MSGWTTTGIGAAGAANETFCTDTGGAELIDTGGVGISGGGIGGAVAGGGVVEGGEVVEGGGMGAEGAASHEFE